jgi:hypothetical protein
MLNLFSFALAVLGIFFIFKLDPKELVAKASSLVVRKKKQNLDTQIRNSINPKKPRGFKKLILETREILELTRKAETFTTLVLISLVLFIAAVILCVAIENYFLIPVLGAGLSMIPFWYTVFTYSFWRRQLNAELETALSIITSSYMRSGNLITAVEENVQYLNSPVLEVFEAFLAQSVYINSNLEKAILDLKFSVNNGVFEEWCDALIACQQDNTLKHTLIPITKKLSDVRTIGAELNNLLYAPVKEFITMTLLVASAPVIMYFLNKDWYITLTTSSLGKLVITITVAIIFIAAGAVIRHTRPIEYRR